MTRFGFWLAYRRRTDRPVEVNALLVIDSIGVTPLPPQKATIGLSLGVAQNVPIGPLTSRTSPADTWSINQLETTPPATRLTVTTRSSSVSGALDME